MHHHGKAGMHGWAVWGKIIGDHDLIIISTWFISPLACVAESWSRKSDYSFVCIMVLFSGFAEKPREACFDPGNIMNGTRLGMDYKLGSTVTYECDSGYTTMGPPTLTCIIGTDGKPIWDKALPTCKGKTAMVCYLNRRCQLANYLTNVFQLDFWQNLLDICSDKD